MHFKVLFAKSGPFIQVAISYTFIHTNCMIYFCSCCWTAIFGRRELGVHITVMSKWARWRLKSPASRLFTQPFIQVQDKKSKLRVTGLCAGNSPVTGTFPAQMAGNHKSRNFNNIIIQYMFDKFPINIQAGFSNVFF